MIIFDKTKVCIWNLSKWTVILNSDNKQQICKVKKLYKFKNSSVSQKIRDWFFYEGNVEVYIYIIWLVINEVCVEETTYWGKVFTQGENRCDQGLVF